jgi:hypothetical protein
VSAEPTADTKRDAIWRQRSFLALAVAIAVLGAVSIGVCASLDSLDDPCRKEEGSLVVAVQNLTDSNVTVLFDGDEIARLDAHSTTTALFPAKFEGELPLVAIDEAGEEVYARSLSLGSVRDLCKPSARLMISE